MDTLRALVEFCWQLLTHKSHSQVRSIFAIQLGQVVHVEVDTVPTAVEYVPAPHAVNVSDPLDGLYFSATHTVHVPPLDPENPHETNLISDICDQKFAHRQQGYLSSFFPTLIDLIIGFLGLIIKAKLFEIFD